MAIKNLFGRGIGFASGLVSWVVTRGYGMLSGGGPTPETTALTGRLSVQPRMHADAVVIQSCLVGDSLRLMPRIVVATITILPA